MTAEERRMLVELAIEGNTIIQIRNNLLFHPSLSSSDRELSTSKLIEIHHTSPGRYSELEEMLFCNLLLIVRIANSEPRSLNVCTIQGAGYFPDILNLYLTFNNGSAASLTFSFLGKKGEHSVVVHSASGANIYNFKENSSSSKFYDSKTYSSIAFGNKLIFRQIEALLAGLENNQVPDFTLSDEMKTYDLIEKVSNKLEYRAVLN
jgi:hypothetical protein